ncbi:MAG TPA: hypothetical protein VN256_23155 [Pyrinomonadaceae bacterium]|nr:hypothetical protein [Pyrinomonadaceae bacterium]
MLRRRTARTIERPGRGRSPKSFALTLALLVCALVPSTSAQEAGHRPARSLTSEDLLNRPAVYVPQPVPNSRPLSSGSITAAGATRYRDPSGAFTLSFPNGNWRVNTKAVSSGSLYHQRTFRRIESEGYASATANVYVLTERSGLPVVDPSRLSAEGQRDFANALSALFLSNNASVVSVAPVSTGPRSGQLRIVADQIIARRVAVRASISVSEREGRLFVVVCRASPETFDAYLREFEIITNSLASSAART